jgi:hypothetical protein
MNPYSGGGNGWGVRNFGSAADNVVEFEVIVMSGSGSGVEVKRVNAREDPELFWGLKGGGKR